MSDPLVIDIDGLVGHPEAKRRFSGVRQVSLRLGDASIQGPMYVEGEATGTVDGVLTTFTVSAPAEVTCVRCLTQWADEITAEAIQHFSRIPDEDGYAIEGRHVDLSGPATDELALAIPPAPLCRPDCKGLCPICGTDLNDEPEHGHGEESDSPFAVLKDLFDS